MAKPFVRMMWSGQHRMRVLSIFALFLAAGCSKPESPRKFVLVEDGDYSFLELAPYIYPSPPPDAFDDTSYVCFGIDLIDGNVFEHRIYEPPKCDATAYYEMVQNAENYAARARWFKVGSQVATHMSLLLYDYQCKNAYFEIVSHYSSPVQTRDIISLSGCYKASSLMFTCSDSVCRAVKRID